MVRERKEGEKYGRGRGMYSSCSLGCVAICVMMHAGNRDENLGSKNGDL